MAWDVIVPTAAGVVAGLLSAWFRSWMNRRVDAASVHDSQSAAMARYWQRIEALENEVERLERELQHAYAQAGQLRVRLDRYERE